MKPDVNAVITIRLGDQLKREWKLAILLFLLGAVALYAGLEGGGFKPTLAGGVLVAFGLAAAIVPRLGLQRDQQVMTELTPTGVTFQIPTAGGPPLRIGWDDIAGITRMSFIQRVLRSYAIYRREPAIILSADFLQRLDEEGEPHRGILWRHYWRDGGPGEAPRLVFHHHDFGLPRFRVHEALESRWRAFSRHPHASGPRMAPPLIDQIDEAIDRVFEKPALRLAGLALVVLLLLPAAWYWHYAVTWLQRPLSNPQAAVYLRDLLDKGGVPALVDRRTLALVRQAEVARAHQPGCQHVIKPDPGPGLTPSYKRVYTCYAALELNGNRRATAVFMIDVVHHEAVVAADYATGRSITRRVASVAAVAPDLAAAEVLLCQLGYCAVR